MKRTIVEELTEQLHESQVEICALRDVLTLLIARLVAASVVDSNFLGDMIVCADGVHDGRTRFLLQCAPKDLTTELATLEAAVIERRGALMTAVERLTAAYDRGSSESGSLRSGE